MNVRQIPQRGVTLIEAVLYISISMGIIVGGLAFYQQAALSSQVLEQVRVLSGTMAEVRALLRTTSWRPVSAPDSHQIDDVLVACGAVPPEIVVAPDPLDARAPRLRNEWGGALVVEGVAGADVGLSDSFLVALGLEEIPLAACTRMAVVDAGGAGIFGGGVRTVTMTGAGGGSGNLPLPVSPSDAATACGTAAGGSGTVSLRFLVDAEH